MRWTQDRKALITLLCDLAPVQFTPHSVVSLATPDFSMPYNVCCLSSTLLAIFFGAMLNLLISRPRIAALQARSKSARRRKILFIIFMLVAFMFLAVFLDADLHNWVVGHLQQYGYPHDSLF